MKYLLFLLRQSFFLLISFTGFAGFSVADDPVPGNRVTYNFNVDWKFIQANPDGAEASDYDDSGWIGVSCPHTFNDVDSFDDLSEGRHHGEPVKLHGWGQKPTGAWAGLGAALPDWLRDYTFRLMDEAGGNFIRWGHCAGSPAEADMADKYGFVTLMPGIAG